MKVAFNPQSSLRTGVSGLGDSTDKGDNMNFRVYYTRGIIGAQRYQAISYKAELSNSNGYESSRPKLYSYKLELI
jgi:hypothetical protein